MFIFKSRFNNEAHLPYFVCFHCHVCLDVSSEWLYQLSQGVDREPVRPRQLPKSLGCGKNFPGKGKLATTDQVKTIFSLGK